MEIELFTSPTCVRCPATKTLLKKLLDAKGINFEETVKIKDIKADPEAMTDLFMLNSYSTPTVKIGETVLMGDITEEQLKEALDGATK